MAMTPTILVTGGTGFTGGHLCQRLAGSGVEVRALVRDVQKSTDLTNWGVDVVPGDLRDPKSLRVAMKGIKTVYHVGALFRAENVSRQDMWDVNVQGTQSLLDVAIEEGVTRFVHCSTIGVHGDVKHPPADEAAPYNPGDYYQDSKTAGEQLVLEYSRKGKLPIVTFRPGGIYGPRDLRFLKLFKAIKQRKFIMLGSGNILYQLIYIDDLIDGILLCGSVEGAVGNVYILTGEHPVTLNHLVEVIAKVVGGNIPRLHLPVTPIYLAGWACELLCKPFGINPPLYRRRVDFFRKTRSFSINKAQTELGFRPSTDLTEGISLTYQWYQQQSLL